MNVNGGDGNSQKTGGGAGGRISVYTTKNIYRGTYLAFGGTSAQSSFGGPGTVFLQDIRFKRPYTQLHIDNLMRSVKDAVTLDEVNTTLYTFSEVHLFRRAAINMVVHGQKNVLTMKRLFGDRTGLIHAQANQTMYLEASETEHSVSKPAVNLRIDKDAEMVFGTSLYVIGDGAKGTGQITGDSSFTLDGRMTDVTSLIIAKRLKSRFLLNAHSADYHNNTLVVSNVGSFVLATLEIQDGAELLFPDEQGIRCDISLLHMKYGSSLVSDRYRVGVTSLLLESGSRITASGKDRPTPHVGATVPSACRGSGGSHASKGGKGKKREFRRWRNKQEQYLFPLATHNPFTAMFTIQIFF